MNLLVLLFSFLIFFPALVIHEYAHGWVAYRLGDSTAKDAGRLTLNPLAHIDPIGTLLLPIVLLLLRAPFVFGWARPVPVTFWNLKNPKRDMIWVGLAGIAANVCAAVAISLILRLPLVLHPLLFVILNQCIEINLVLAVFNLIPVPPLDGSRVIYGLLPNRIAKGYIKIEPYGIVIIAAFLYLGIIEKVVWPSVIFLHDTLLAGVKL